MADRTIGAVDVGNFPAWVPSAASLLPSRSLGCPASCHQSKKMGEGSIVGPTTFGCQLAGPLIKLGSHIDALGRRTAKVREGLGDLGGGEGHGKRLVGVNRARPWARS